MRLTFLGMLLVLALAASGLWSAEPALDCSLADGEVEELICSDEGLAELDRQMAQTWSAALANAEVDGVAPDLRAFQRSWIEGRNECWMADDVATCIRFSYLTRLTELEIHHGLVEAPDYESLVCDDRNWITVVFYEQTTLPAAVLTRLDEQVVVFRSEREEGAERWVGRNVTFRRGEEAWRLSWKGAVSLCQERDSLPARPGDGGRRP